MRLLSIFKNSRGVSFIQVLLASSAIAGLAVVGLKLAEDQKALAMKTSENYLAEYLTQEVKFLLSDAKTCQNTLRGVSFKRGEIDVIKRSEGIIEHLHFPVSKEKLFNAQLEIVGYDVSNESVDDLLKKGMTFLFIKMKMERKKRLITKKTPLIFKSEGGQSISECHAGINELQKVTDGFWDKEENRLHLKNLKLRVGKKVNHLAQVQVEGALHLLKHDLTPCQQAQDGLLKNIHGKLRYCLKGKWHAFGLSDPQWQNLKFYKVEAHQKGERIEKTKVHRHCFLVGQIKKEISDGCSLKRLVRQYNSPYEMKAYTSSLATKNICEVACVD